MSIKLNSTHLIQVKHIYQYIGFEPMDPPIKGLRWSAYAFNHSANINFNVLSDIYLISDVFHYIRIYGDVNKKIMFFILFLKKYV